MNARLDLSGNLFAFYSYVSLGSQISIGFVFLQTKNAESSVIQEMLQKSEWLYDWIGWLGLSWSKREPLAALRVLSAPTFMSPFRRLSLQLTIKSELYFAGKSVQLQVY